MAVAAADPADPRRQALEPDPCFRHVQPVVKMPVVGHQLLHPEYFRQRTQAAQTTTFGSGPLADSIGDVPCDCSKTGMCIHVRATNRAL
jgi:hypothetical protein